MLAFPAPRGKADIPRLSSLTYAGRSRRRSEMDDETENKNRIEALANAVRHRLKDETADDIVESAKKYFKFLQGDDK